MSEDECEELKVHNNMMRHENDLLAKKMIQMDVVIARQTDTVLYLEETCRIYSLYLLHQATPAGSEDGFPANEDANANESTVPITGDANAETVPGAMRPVC